MQFSLVITSLFIPFPFWDQIIIIIIICPRHEKKYKSHRRLPKVNLQSALTVFGE
jgi:hypothetical protein